MSEKETHILEYLQKIRSASKELTKKEAFKDLLNRLYGHNEQIKKIIDRMTLGAETTVFNIPRKDKFHRGAADTFYNNVIIEFENDLRKSLAHAKEQLAGYLLGQLHSGDGYNYILIVSDFINWKIFAPDIDCIPNLYHLKENELILNEAENASFTLNEENADEFYYWIDRFLFKEEKQKATLQSIEDAFGWISPVFVESKNELNKWFENAKKYGMVQVSYEQWHKFLSIAYGSYQGTESDFLTHTYLSIFSKLLAYSILSNNDFYDDEEIKFILDGSGFYRYYIDNFVENDFFHWVYNEQNFVHLKKVFRLIAQEISTFNFENVKEDILKGIYQELIDIDTRHSLGEYYTPDWLCERIVGEFDFRPTDKILDPSCGSGSFLRAAINRIRNLHPEISIENINSQIYGIDIHPLSVQISKTTMILAYGKDLVKQQNFIAMNIFMANTLLAPEGVNNIFGNEFTLMIDKEKYAINTQVLDNIQIFDEMLNFCETVSEQTIGSKTVDLETFSKILKNHFGRNGFSNQIIESFYKIYTGLKKVKENKRDTIWKFIISNLYKPYFYKNRFDYVIGNPPWFTFRSIKNEEYQNILDKLAIQYDVKPKRVANFSNLEIAAIFQAYCSSYFLKENGKIAFVLPRSFFNGSQHENTREGLAKGFRPVEIWDLEHVTPLFNIPSCVFISEKAELLRKIKSAGIQAKYFAGRLPKHNCHLDVAEKFLKEKNITLFYAKQGNESAYTTKKAVTRQKTNPYKENFKNGASIIPRAFYFVDLKEIPDDFTDRTLFFDTSKSILSDAKAPWKGLKFNHQKIESKFLFRTAISKSILPFTLYKPNFIILPILITKNANNKKQINLHTANELLYNGDVIASKYFFDKENIWKINCTEKSRKLTAGQYLNWVNKLTSQNLNARYLVMYTASAKDANTVVLDRQSLDLEFIAESAAYVFYTNNENEAYYLSAILNSSKPNLMMKDFQSRGLFGPRHVSKKILDIYFPKYSEKDPTHLQLAELAKQCHAKTKAFIENNSEIEKMNLGKLRIEIKKQIEAQMREIDEIVQKIIE